MATQDLENKIEQVKYSLKEEKIFLKHHRDQINQHEDKQIKLRKQLIQLLDEKLKAKEGII